MKKPTAKPKRLTKKQREAKAYLDAHWSEIVLHTLYQRWNLPTSLLRAKP